MFGTSGRIEEIKDIEENIWSPRLGIKGKVDMTVQVKLHNKDKQVQPISFFVEFFYLFEIKEYFRGAFLRRFL